MKFKVAVIAIVLVLVALYVAGLGLGARGDGLALPTLDLSAGGSERVRGWLTVPLKTEAIGDDDPDDDCTLRGTTFTVPAGQDCTFTIAASTKATRRLELRLAQGERAVVTLKQDRKKALSIEQTLTTPMTTTLALDIYRDPDDKNADLTLKCDGGEADCLLEIR